MRFIPLFCLLLVSLFSYAQYDLFPELSEKYWSYRNRLTEQFMICQGEGPGCSLPASMRNTYDHQYKGNTTIKWGDGTIDLAHYIAVLATESKLLEKNSQDQRKTLNELYYALEAFNRLDYYGDTCFGSPSALNGFFIRSDAGAGFVAEPQKRMDAIQKLNKPASEVTNITSEFLNYTQGNTRLFAMSKDQVFHLLMAMKLVVFSIPDSVKSDHPFFDTETGFADEARNITNRILNWIHTESKSNFPSNWRVRLPSGKKVKTGNNAWTYAIPLNYIRQAITGEAYKGKKGVSYFAAKLIYQLSWSGFRPIFFFNRSEGFKTLLLESLTGKRKNRLERIIRLSYAFPPYEWIFIPLLYTTLNPTANSVSDHTNYFEILKLAPKEGPYNFGTRANGGFWWSSTTLINHPQRRKQDLPHFPGRYNGLDYMLIYNLLLLSK